MKQLTIVLLINSFLFSCSTEKKFDFPINEIESIKEYDYQNKPYYKSLTLTPETYYSNSSCSVQKVTASFLYKEKKAGIEIVVDYDIKRILFVSLGEESDYFVFVISELFEEPVDNQKMKKSVECSFWDGEPSDRSLLSQEQHYKVGYDPDPESSKGSVQISLTIDLIHGKIELGEKNAGIAKKNFVDAFVAND